ncbi:MAG: NTP transferase domain-containing protein [Deltaproteobacteria bacterium]|nr:NTP transferase domain-containing protein [Deltaproteobacteria bacterium]
MESNFPPLILLAGGKSERMGKPKGLLRYRETYWLEEQISRFQKLGGKQVIIGLGYRAKAYFRAIPPLEEALVNGVRYLNITIRSVVNPQPEFGKFSTLQVCLKLFLQEQGANSTFVLPIDVPVCSKTVWMNLFKALSKDVEAVTPTYRNRGGHPVLLTRVFCQQLAKLPKSSRLDFELKSLARRKVVAVNDPVSVLNLNTPKKWKDFNVSQGNSS